MASRRGSCWCVQRRGAASTLACGSVLVLLRGRSDAGALASGEYEDDPDGGTSSPSVRARYALYGVKPVGGVHGLFISRLGLGGVAAGGGGQIGRGSLALPGAHNPSMMISRSRGDSRDRFVCVGWCCRSAAEPADDRGDVFPGEVSPQRARALRSLYEVVEQFGQASLAAAARCEDRQLGLSSDA